MSWGAYSNVHLNHQYMFAQYYSVKVDYTVRVSLFSPYSFCSHRRMREAGFAHYSTTPVPFPYKSIDILLKSFTIVFYLL